MLTALGAQFDAAKQVPSKPAFDWRTGDWSKWEAGRGVDWRDLFDDSEASDVVVDGKTYVFADAYCVQPGCTCEEVNITIWHEDERDGALTDIGYVCVSPNMLAGAVLDAHGPERELVKRVWKAWCDTYPVVALLLTRQAAVRKLAPEFQALLAKRRSAPVSRAAKSKDVGPNKPCPCGSGKKFKKCCMGA